VLAAVGGAIDGGVGLAANQPPTIPVIERNLANALAKSRTLLLRLAFLAWVFAASVALVVRPHRHTALIPQRAP
jgi:hypothetical protein